MGSKVREEEREREGARTEREGIGEGWGRDDARAERGREGEGWSRHGERAGREGLGHARREDEKGRDGQRAERGREGRGTGRAMKEEEKVTPLRANLLVFCAGSGCLQAHPNLCVSDCAAKWAIQEGGHHHSSRATKWEKAEVRWEKGVGKDSRVGGGADS